MNAAITILAQNYEQMHAIAEVFKHLGEYKPADTLAALCLYAARESGLVTGHIESEDPWTDADQGYYALACVGMGMHTVCIPMPLLTEAAQELAVASLKRRWRAVHNRRMYEAPEEAWSALRKQWRSMLDAIGNDYVQKAVTWALAD